MINREKSPTIRRGEIWWVDINDKTVGCEQTGTRPCLVLQNDIGNRYSPLVIVALITTKEKAKLPTHHKIDLISESTVMLEHIRTLDKSRFGNKIKSLTTSEMAEINKKLLVSLGMQ